MNAALLGEFFQVPSMGFSSLTKFFPLMLLVCNASSAVCYAFAGDYRRSLYWAASTICVGAVTF
jgi:hypothetical protein